MSIEYLSAPFFPRLNHSITTNNSINSFHQIIPSHQSITSIHPHSIVSFCSQTQTSTHTSSSTVISSPLSSASISLPAENDPFIMPRPSLLVRAALALLAFSSVTTSLMAKSNGSNVVREKLQTIYKHLDHADGEPAEYIFPTIVSIKQQKGHLCDKFSCGVRTTRGNTKIAQTCHRPGTIPNPIITTMCTVVEAKSCWFILNQCTMRHLVEYSDGAVGIITRECDVDKIHSPKYIQAMMDQDSGDIIRGMSPATWLQEGMKKNEL